MPDRTSSTGEGKPYGLFEEVSIGRQRAFIPKGGLTDGLNGKSVVVKCL